MEDILVQLCPPSRSLTMIIGQQNWSWLHFEFALTPLRQAWLFVSTVSNIMYRVCQKSDILLVSEFSTLVRCIIFAIFVYLYTVSGKKRPP